MVPGTNGSGDGFESAVDGYLADMFADAPALATFHGWDGVDDASPDLSAAAIAEREARDDRWLDRFAAFGDDELDVDQRIDRDLVVAVLRGRRALRDWEGWRRAPDHYLSPALMGVFSLFLRRDDVGAALVAAADSRLRAVPALLDAGVTNLDPALVPPLFIERALGQCRAGVTYARDLVPAEVDGDAGRADLAEAGAVAAEAFARFAAHLEEMLPRARGDWAIGAARYSTVLRDAELLADDADGLHERGRAAWAALDGEMATLARTIDPGLDAGDGWRPVVEACGREHPATPDEMRRAYEAETARARAFLAERGLVTFAEGERCEVVPSPPFQRPVLAVASYHQPPAFKPSLVGRFNVPYPPAGAPPDEVDKRLADNGHHAIPTITTHEAYPGHHWHLTTMSGARALRRVHRSAYFTEGWGLYAERVMREQGYFADARAELMHLDFRLFRAARIVVDTALHAGEMTVDQAVAHLRERAGLTEPVARAEVGRYCSWPTQAAAYLTGCLEIERIRDRWFAEDRGDLRSFHDAIAATGGLPIALAERATLP
ncbi:MAG TPA: DUF885 domain-containing protein [Acidimicrobiales bacterium]